MNISIKSAFYQAVLADDYNYIKYVLSIDSAIVNTIYFDRSMLLWVAQYGSLDTLRLCVMHLSADLINCVALNSNGICYPVNFLTEYVRKNLTNLRCSFKLREQLIKLINDLTIARRQELRIVINIRPSIFQTSAAEKDLVYYCYFLLGSNGLFDAILDAGYIPKPSAIINHIDEESEEFEFENIKRELRGIYCYHP